MLEIAAIELSKKTVQTKEEFKIAVTIRETIDYPYDYPYDYPIAYEGDGHY